MSTEEKTIRYQILFRESDYLFDHTVSVTD